MFILIAVFIVIVITGIVIERKTEFELTGEGLKALGIILICLTLVTYAVFYFVTINEIQQYYATKETIAIAREGEMKDIERAALTQKIIETNSWLASQKYLNKTLLDMAVPDEIENLEPLK